MAASKVLTAAAVRTFRPGAERREIPDGATPGLRLLVHPSGARSWVMRFRRPNSTTGATAKMTLGSVDLTGKEAEAEPVIGGHLTLAAARKLAAEVHRQRALGRDPAADRQSEKRRIRLAAAERARSTFAAAAVSFVEEHARPKVRRWKETARILGLAPDTLDLIRGGLADRWREKPVAEVTGHDVYGVVDECRRRGVPGLKRRRKGMTDSRARAMFTTLSKFFAWLVEHRVVTSNPCAGVHKPDAAPARERVLSDDEVRWFWQACEQDGEPFCSLLKLLLVTGQRLNEVARMTRSEVSDDGKTWTLPGARTKNKRSHVVPLSSLAREVIGGVREVVGKPGYIFTTTGETPVSGFSRAKARIDAAMLAVARREAEAAGRDPDAVAIAPWRIHDLRRTAVTGMARAGADLHVIERAINHVSGSFGGIVSTYQRHRYADEVRAALEAWANLLGEVVLGKSEENRNVLPFSQKARTP